MRFSVRVLSMRFGLDNLLTLSYNKGVKALQIKLTRLWDWFPPENSLRVTPISNNLQLSNHQRLMFSGKTIFEEVHRDVLYRKE